MEKRTKKIFESMGKREFGKLMDKQADEIVKAGLKGHDMRASGLGEDLELMLEAEESGMIGKGHKRKVARKKFGGKKSGMAMLQELEQAGDIFRANATDMHRNRAK